MQKNPVASFLGKRSRYVLIGLLLIIGAFSGYKMLQLPLWGWWPLPLLLGFYMAIALLFYPKKPTQKKWFGAVTLAGILMGLGFPPSPLTFVVIFAWIPLLAVENSIYLHREKIQARKVWFYSFHAFVLWNIIATFWVTNTAFAAGIFANFVNAAFMATTFMIYHIFRRKLHWVSGAVILIAIWITFEYIHHHWELSWPWLTLGNAMAEYPLAVQWYDLTGVFGGSLWILALNYFGYWIVLRWMRAKPTFSGWYASLLLIPVALSCLYSLFWTLPPKEGLKNVVIVQPNFEPHYEKFDIPQREQLRRFLELSRSAVDEDTRYLVFPETSFDGIRLNDFNDNQIIRDLRNFIDQYEDLRLVTGLSTYRILDKDSLDDANYRIHVNSAGDTTYWDIQNAAVQLTSGTTEYQVYFKSKLVPGPEIFPFRKLLFFLQPLVESLGGTYEGHTIQKDREVFTGGQLSVAPLICYESIYGEYTGDYVQQGATALFIVTNDGWWDKTPGHVQHLKLGALRAIEHRRPVFRSANTGISAFIVEKGLIHSPTRYGEAAVIKGLLYGNSNTTFYTRHGDYIARIATGLTLFLLLWTLVRSIRTRGTNDRIKNSSEE